MNQLRGKVLLVSQDDELAMMLSDFLVPTGLELKRCSDLSSAPIAVVQDEAFDVVLYDNEDQSSYTPDTSTLLTTLFRDKSVHTQILILTSSLNRDASESIRKDAFQIITKPFHLDDLLLSLERALEHGHLHVRNSMLETKCRLSHPPELDGLIGRSPAIRHIFELIKRVSQATANVLIQGESGTGKEIIAKSLHNQSRRSSGPFVAINCAAIPETLLESELFGHAKGAFTGAQQRKKGLFEEANGGTLFLDEIGDLPTSLQSKLLRVIQERRVRAVGENEDRTIDIRIISATHRDLKQMIAKNQFRDDLFYRLNVIPIRIPPLRERTEDIPLLANHFLERYSVLNNRKIRGFSEKAMAKLLSNPWPGNVRELENVIERAVVLCSGFFIEEKDLSNEQEPPSPPLSAFENCIQDFPTLQELEKRYMHLVLKKTAGRKDYAARILGINRRTLYRKERELGFFSNTTLPDHSEHLNRSEEDFFSLFSQ